MSEEAVKLKNHANILASQGRYIDAEQIYKQALRINPNYAHLYCNLANIYFLTMRIDEAVGEYRKAIKIDNSLIQAHTGLAKSLYSLGEYQECINICSELLCSYPSLENIRITISQAQSALGLFEEAIALAEEQIDQFPDSINSLVNYFALLVGHDRDYRSILNRMNEFSDHIDKSFQLGLLKAQCFLHLGEYQKCIDHCNTMLLRFKQDLSQQFWWILATSYFKCCKYNEVLRLDLTKLLNDADYAPTITFMLAQCYECTGVYELALKFYDRSSDVGNPRSLLESARIASEYFDYTCAIDRYKRYIEIVPDDYLALSNLSFLLASIGSFSEAMLFVQDSLKIVRSSSALLNCALIYKEQGLLEKASSICLEIIDQDKLDDLNVSNALADLAEIYWLQESYSKSFSTIQNCLERFPSNPRARFILSKHLLMNLDFINGWNEYAYRVPSQILGKARLETMSLPNIPLWNGKCIAGTLFVSAEQGLGDQIMFASMLLDLKLKCDVVLLQSDSRLHTLYERSFSTSFKHLGLTATPKDSSIVSQISIADLGKFFRASKESFVSSADGYLKACPDQTLKLRKNLCLSGKKHIIGISWKSIPLRYHNQRRNLSLRDFAEGLSSDEILLVPLQYGNISDEIYDLSIDYPDLIYKESLVCIDSDIDGLAALICACDCVVSVSNTTVALAGALGVPTNVLLPKAPGWIWGKSDDIHSIWWSNVRKYYEMFPDRHKHSFTAIFDSLNS